MAIWRVVAGVAILLILVSIVVILAVSVPIGILSEMTQVRR